ncbi:DUF6344 domain-containing protein [Streptomyces sp. NPDC004327]|uniref:DUF6344 domain-containing protein n=1 Tax=Streptomyces sp. NPDC004327 TaxID=3364699 RepID=UPI0036ABF7FF
MAAAKQCWTAFVSVLFALLASLGLATPAAAAAQPALTQGEEPALTGAAATAAARPAVPVPAQRSHEWRRAQGRALPPTMKQRIGAEAHGSSPAVRHLRSDALTDGADGADGDLTGLALAAAGGSTASGPTALASTASGSTALAPTARTAAGSAAA